LLLTEDAPTARTRGQEHILQVILLPGHVGKECARSIWFAGNPTQVGLEAIVVSGFSGGLDALQNKCRELKGASNTTCR
jgi:hypothetical protein